MDLEFQGYISCKNVIPDHNNQYIAQVPLEQQLMFIFSFLKWVTIIDKSTPYKVTAIIPYRVSSKCEN